MKIDFSKERNVWFILGLFGISYVFSLLIQWLEHHLPESVQEFIEMFHVFTIPINFYILVKLFENYLWKWKIWEFIKIVNFPDLNGIYKGKFTSSFKDENGKNFEGKMTLKIKQSFSKITINCIFDLSKSISTKAFFAFNDLEQKNCLYYFFQNKPEKNAVEEMHIHEGSAILSYDEVTKKLEGEYYSGRDRNNYGNIKVIKIDDKKISRLFS